MIYCYNCGQQQKGTGKFCINCGKPLKTQSTPNLFNAVRGANVQQHPQLRENLSKIYNKLKDDVIEKLKDDNEYQEEFMLGEEELN